jgi:hypothetical protein
MKYIVRSLDGREYGPFTSDQLQELKDAQRLGPGDFIRRETGKTWSPFEKIPGLGDVEGGDATIRDDPPDAGPSGRPVPGESTDEPVLAATDPLVDDLRTDEPETPPVPTTGPSTSQIELDIARASASADLLVQHGVLVSRLPGETDVFELQQSFLDVAKQSLLAALLGRRGVLVCTSRRVAIVLPSVSSKTIRIAYPGMSRSIGIERRTSLIRLIFGLMLFLNAVISFLGSSLLGGITSALDQAAGLGITQTTDILGLGIAGLFAAAGAFLIITSNAKALVIEAGEPIIFPCSRASAWHLGRLDDAHHICVDAMNERPQADGD